MESGEQRRILRVLYTPNIPYVNPYCRTFPHNLVSYVCPFPGFYVEYGLISNQPRLQILTFKNENSVSGVLGFVANGTVDTIAMSIASNKQREHLLVTTENLYYSTTKLIVNWPERSYEEYFAFFQSYSGSAWVAIAVSLILQCLLCVIVQNVESKFMETKPCGVIDSVWQIVRLQLLHPQDVQFRLVSGKVAIITFSFVQCAIIMGVLSSYIFSNLIRGPKRLPFGSFHQFTELIADGTLHLVDRFPDGMFYESVRHYNLSSGDMFHLQRALQRNPVRYGRSIAEVLEMMNEPGAVMIKSEDEHLSFETHRNCRLEMIDTVLPAGRSHMVLRAGSAFLADFNKVIPQEQHTFKRLWYKYMRDFRARLECRKPKKRVIGAEYPYIGTILVVGVVELVGFLVLLAELLAFRLRHPSGDWQRK